jgi:uncharacterized protein (DUF1330 family)
VASRHRGLKFSGPSKPRAAPIQVGVTAPISIIAHVEGSGMGVGIGIATHKSIHGDKREANHKVAIALVAGTAIGGAAVQGLYAQAKPPVYVVSEITVNNVDAYAKEYVPLAQAALKKAGGKLVAVSQTPISLEGAPENARVTINVFDSLEQAQASRSSPDYKAARAIGDKYATHRTFVVEGLPK